MSAWRQDGVGGSGGGSGGAEAGPHTTHPLSLAARPLEPVAPPPAAAGPPLRVLTWNVLADGLAQHGAFARCPRAALEWESRAAAVLAELQAAAADILLLQEVNRYDELAAALAGGGYEGRFWAKPASPATGLGFPADGCAVFWRGDRFRLLDARGRPFTAQQQQQQAATNGAAAPLPLRDPSSSSSDGPPSAAARGVQGMLLVTLADGADGGRPVAAACVHLKAKPGAAQAALRAAQAADAAAAAVQAAEAATNGGGAKQPLVLVGGDFNDHPDSAAAAAAAAAGLTSVWSLLPRPVDTTFKIRTDGAARRCSDYIFVGGGARVVSVAPPPADIAAADIAPDGLPCAGYPSDHVAVLAVVCGD